MIQATNGGCVPMCYIILNILLMNIWIVKLDETEILFVKKHTRICWYAIWGYDIYFI